MKWSLLPGVIPTPYLNPTPAEAISILSGGKHCYLEARESHKIKYEFMHGSQQKDDMGSSNLDPPSPFKHSNYQYQIHGNMHVIFMIKHLRIFKEI